MDDEEEDEEVKKEEVEIDMTDDINALVADEDLSEEFKAKAKTIFEGAVAAKVKEQMTEAEAKTFLISLEKELNLPATDPFRFGADKLVDALASIT